MILNTYALLDGFVALLRLFLAGFVIYLSVAIWRKWNPTASSDGRSELENRSYLLFALALMLLVLNLASWPILYMLLQSYVSEWPGVMCIYGVTQIGSGSQGASRFLPDVLRALQILKPVLVFVSGAWMMLYLANRRTETAPLMGRVLVTLTVLGMLAALDSTVEITYLVIPKKEDFYSAGCCMIAEDSPGRFLPSSIVGENGRSWLSRMYYGLNGVIILALLVQLRTSCFRVNRLRLTLLFAGALIALFVSGVFLLDVAAPVLLHMPNHHCAYDLIPQVPEVVLAVASYIAGTLAVGWGCVAAWLADCPESRPFLREQVRVTLAMGVFGYLGAMLMLSIELALNS